MKYKNNLKAPVFLLILIAFLGALYIGNSKTTIGQGTPTCSTNSNLTVKTGEICKLRGIQNYTSITIQSGGTIIYDKDLDLNISGDFILNGSLNGSNTSRLTLNVGGKIEGSGIIYIINPSGGTGIMSISSNGKIDISKIYSESYTWNGGITIKSNKAITVNSIYTDSDEKDGGPINITANGDINITEMVQSKGDKNDGGKIEITSYNGNITIPTVTTRSYESGGPISISAKKGDITISSIEAPGRHGKDGGAVTIEGKNIIVTEIDASGQDDSGNITITGGNINIDTISNGCNNRCGKINIEGDGVKISSISSGGYRPNTITIKAYSLELDSISSENSIFADEFGKVEIEVTKDTSINSIDVNSYKGTRKIEITSKEGSITIGEIDGQGYNSGYGAEISIAATNEITVNGNIISYSENNNGNTITLQANDKITINGDVRSGNRKGSVNHQSEQLFIFSDKIIIGDSRIIEGIYKLELGKGIGISSKRIDIGNNTRLISCNLTISALILIHNGKNVNPCTGEEEEVGKTFLKTGKRPIEDTEYNGGDIINVSTYVDKNGNYVSNEFVNFSDGATIVLSESGDYEFGEEELKDKLNTDDVLEEGKDVSWTTFYYKYERPVMIIRKITQEYEECSTDPNTGQQVCSTKQDTRYELESCVKEWTFTHRYMQLGPEFIRDTKKYLDGKIYSSPQYISNQFNPSDKIEITYEYNPPEKIETTISWTDDKDGHETETFTCNFNFSPDPQYIAPFDYYPSEFENFISEAGYYFRGAQLFDSDLERPWDAGEVETSNLRAILPTETGFEQVSSLEKIKLPVAKFVWDKVMGWIDSNRGPDRYKLSIFNTQGNGVFEKIISKDKLDRYPLSFYPMMSTLSLSGKKSEYDIGKGHWEQGKLVDLESLSECGTKSEFIMAIEDCNKFEPEYDKMDFTGINYKELDINSGDDLYLFYDPQLININVEIDDVYDFYDYLNTVENYYRRYFPIVYVSSSEKLRGDDNYLTTEEGTRGSEGDPPVNSSGNYHIMNQCLLKSGTYFNVGIQIGYQNNADFYPNSFNQLSFNTSIAPEPKYPFDPDFSAPLLGPNINWGVTYGKIYPQTIYGKEGERDKLYQILYDYYTDPNVNLTEWYDENGNQIPLEDAIENNIDELYRNYPVLFEWCPVDYPADYTDPSKGTIKAESYYLKFWQDEFWGEKYSKLGSLWIGKSTEEPKWEKYCPYNVINIDPTSPACLANLRGQILGEYHGTIVNKTTYPPPFSRGDLKLTPRTFKVVEPYFRATLQDFTNNVLYKWSVATCLRDNGIACQKTNDGGPDDNAKVSPLTEQEEALGYYYGAEMGQEWIFVGEAEFIERGFRTPKESPTLVNIGTIVDWNFIKGARIFDVELFDITNGTPGNFAGVAIVAGTKVKIGDLWLAGGYSDTILKPGRWYSLRVAACSKNPLDHPSFSGSPQNYPENPSLLYKTNKLSEIETAIKESCQGSLENTITIITAGQPFTSEDIRVPSNIPDKIGIIEKPEHFGYDPDNLVNDYRQGIGSYYLTITENNTGEVFHKIILDPIYNFDYNNPEAKLDYPEIKPNYNYEFTIRVCADRFSDIKDIESIPQERIEAFCGEESPETTFDIFELKPPEIIFPEDGKKAQVGFYMKWKPQPQSVTPRYYKYEFEYLNASDKEVSQKCLDKVGNVIFSNIISASSPDKEQTESSNIYCLGDYKLKVYSCIENSCSDFVSSAAEVNFTLIQPQSGGDIFSIVPCGRKTDDPKTNWIDEREPCGLAHGFILIKMTFDFLITRFLLIAAILMVVFLFASNYVFRLPALTHQAATGLKYVGIGYGIAIFGWVIITFLTRMMGMSAPLISIGF